jgi:hypothetical protein
MTAMTGHPVCHSIRPKADVQRLPDAVDID